MFSMLLVAFTFVGAEPAVAQDAGGDAVTLTAQVIDFSCALVQGASGEDHRACAQACADMGQPLGFLTEDGEFLLPVNEGMGAEGMNGELHPFAEQDVTVTGRVIERGGMNAIVVDEIAGA
ncbi:MAG: hypothetical protein ACODAE_09090 [Gemmatimonadota bacterium]